ncbi:MAG: hypothetical protein RLZZ150_320, partial [Bacteroidota bacterium]
MCVVLAGTSVWARLPKGVTVGERTPAAVAFRYTPSMKSWDTVVASNGVKTIHPSIDGATVRISPSGQEVQWVVDIDMIVPGPQAFRVERADVKAIDLATSLPFDVQLSDPMYWRSSAPLIPGRWSIAYVGIAGDRHIARISIVVASRSASTGTTITTGADVRVVFTGSTAQTSSTAPTALDVINPRAPWLTHAPMQRSKDLERIQADEFTDVFRMTIDREGLYRITADQLRAAGIGTDAAAASTLKIFGRGGVELPELVDSARS